MAIIKPMVKQERQAARPTVVKKIVGKASVSKGSGQQVQKITGKAIGSKGSGLQVQKTSGKASGSKGSVMSGVGKGGAASGKGRPGSAGGQWVFVPAAQTGARQGRTVVPFSGAGVGTSFRGKGVGKHASQDPKQKKALDKLGKVEAERKVWVGGLPKDVKRGALYAHFKESVKPHLFEVMSKGTACVAFKTAEDAQLAIDILNGSQLDGKEIQVDVWTQKEKKEKKEGEPRERRQKSKPVIKTSFLKGKKGANPIDSKMKAKLKEVDPALKVWVGGLSDDTTWKQVKEHFKDSGCEVDLCDLMKKGTAQCTFKTEEEASSAVTCLNGTDLNGNTIEVDVWAKPERKEKKKKEVKEE